MGESQKMAFQEIIQGRILNTKQVSRQIGGMKLSKFYSLPEDAFNKFIKIIEKDPLFKKLTYSKDKILKVISFKRFPNTDLSTKFYELNEEITFSNTNYFDTASFLKAREEVIPLIKQLGIDRFKQYFLYNEDIISNKKIADECKSSIPDVNRIKNFINDFFIHTGFDHPSIIPPVNQIHYTKIASIEKDTTGGFIIGYFSLPFIKGRYSINYDKIENLKKLKMFSKEEIRQLDKLLKNLKLINKRKTTIYQIIQHIIKTQKEYLKSADSNKLNIITQKELSENIKVHPSVICRIIKFRGIEMPWGEVKPIKFFFSNRKDEIQKLMGNFIKKEKEELKEKVISYAYSDNQIKDKLERNHKINIARRTIREYRNELRIPSASIRTRNISINHLVGRSSSKPYRILKVKDITA